MLIALPRYLDESGAHNLIVSISKCRSDEEVILDFSGIKWAYPYGSLICAETIRQMVAFRRQRGLRTAYLNKGVTLSPIPDACNYLRHIGFFRHIGFPFGNAPGEAVGGSSYFPLTVIKSVEFGVRLPTKKFAEAIRTKSYGLASMLFNTDEARELLAYCFREIIRNVFEHSGVSRCTIMAQKYGKRYVEIAIVDTGCGILSSLDTAYPDLDAASALSRAIEPGISSTRRDGLRGNGINTGFGLYVLSELGNQHGNFAIWSGDCQLSVFNNGKSFEARPHVNGTAVKIYVDTTDAEYFPNWFKDIVARGEANLPVDAIRSDGTSKVFNGIYG